MDASTIEKFLRETRLIRPPKKLLATFGATRIQYHLVSPVEDLPNRTRLREGWVVSERPQILTPDTLRERFEGFGEDAREFSDWISQHFRELLRALEYRFKNQDLTTRVLSQPPRSMALSIRDDINTRDIAQATVIECPDAAWSLALMNFTLEQMRLSFPTNVRDFETHGLFEPGSNEARKRTHEIESLFARARNDPTVRRALSRKLKEYGLFERYEDRFFALFQ